MSTLIGRGRVPEGSDIASRRWARSRHGTAGRGGSLALGVVDPRRPRAARRLRDRPARRPAPGRRSPTSGSPRTSTATAPSTPARRAASREVQPDQRLCARPAAARRRPLLPQRRRGPDLRPGRPRPDRRRRDPAHLPARQALSAGYGIAGLIGATAIADLPGAAPVPGGAADRAAGGDPAGGVARRVPGAASGRRGREFPGAGWGRGSSSALLALVRPEYLPIAFLLPLAWLAGRPGGASCGRRSCRALVSLLGDRPDPRPWTIRNAVALDRVGADLDRRRQGALHRHLRQGRRGRPEAARTPARRSGPHCVPGSPARAPSTSPSRYVLERVLARVAAESYPGLETDAALGRLGRQNLERRPHRGTGLRCAGMLVDKAYATWTDTPRGGDAGANPGARCSWRWSSSASPASLCSPADGASRFWPAAIVLALHDGGRRDPDRLAASRARRPASARGAGGRGGDVVRG